jgi:hypothetical protein
VCVSCGGTAEGLSSATGKVLCDGQPAAGAVLTFHRQAGGDAPPADAAAIIPTATVQDDGGFTVESHPLGYGAAPGKYTILVIWPDDSASPESSASPTPKTATIKGKKVIVANNNRDSRGVVDRLKGRYMDKSKPPLKAEIKSGPNDLGTLELSASTPIGK